MAWARVAAVPSALSVLRQGMPFRRIRINRIAKIVTGTPPSTIPPRLPFSGFSACSLLALPRWLQVVACPLLSLDRRRLESTRVCVIAAHLRQRNYCYAAMELRVRLQHWDCENVAARANNTICPSLVDTQFPRDLAILTHNCQVGHFRLCARIKHAVANELDEPLRNLFQWALLLLGSCTVKW